MSSKSTTQRIFLAGLVFDFTERDLMNFFAKTKGYKSITRVRLIRQKNKKHLNQGSGFIYLTSKREATRILDQKIFELRDRRFTALPYMTGQQLDKFKQDVHKRRLFIHSIALDVTNQDLRAFFGDILSIDDAYLIQKGQQQQAKGPAKDSSNRKKQLQYGYVIVSKAEDAWILLEQRVFKLKGSSMIVLPFDQKKHGKKKEMLKQHKSGSKEDGEDSDEQDDDREFWKESGVKRIMNFRNGGLQHMTKYNSNATRRDMRRKTKKQRKKQTERVMYSRKGNKETPANVVTTVNSPKSDEYIKKGGSKRKEEKVREMSVDSDSGSDEWVPKSKQRSNQKKQEVVNKKSNNNKKAEESEDEDGELYIKKGSYEARKEKKRQQQKKRASENSQKTKKADETLGNKKTLHESSFKKKHQKKTKIVSSSSKSSLPDQQEEDLANAEIYEEIKRMVEPFTTIRREFWPILVIQHPATRKELLKLCLKTRVSERNQDPFSGNIRTNFSTKPSRWAGLLSNNRLWF